MSEYTEEQLKAAARNALANNDPAAARRFVDAARAVAGPAEAAPEPQTERALAAMQGLTFGFADEATAAIKNPLSALGIGGGEEYRAELQSQRDRLSGYRESHPLTSLGWEAGGAILPALAAAPFTGGGSVAATSAKMAPLAVRAMRAAPALAKVGAAQGAVYGIGTGEGGPMNRLKSGAGGAVVGAVMNPVIAGATAPLRFGARKLVDAARSRFGNQAGGAVEAELQRMAQGTGLTPDEIAQKVASGEIMAENETLRMAARALMSEGGEPETIMRGVMSERPPRLRGEAMEAMQDVLAPNADPNPTRVQANMRRAANQAEVVDYAGIPGGTSPASIEVFDAVSAAVAQFPRLGNEMAEFVTGSTRSAPFFTVKGGKITITRPPTLQEGEAVRRFLDAKKGEAYRSGAPMAGLFGDFSQDLRTALDNSSGELAAVRSTARATRDASDAFEYGRKAFSKGADDFEIEFDRVSQLDGGALAALRAGVMSALRRKSTGAGGLSLMSKLQSEDIDYGMILRRVFPDEEAEAVLQRISNSARAQSASNDIIKGPSTALVAAAREKIGQQVNLDDVGAALGMNPIAILRIGSKIAAELAPDLTEAQRTKIMRVLVSEDPEVVLQALRDDSGIARLGLRLQQLAAGISDATADAGIAVGARMGGQSTNMALGMDTSPRVTTDANTGR
mgnify:CR=1 FL=1